MALCRKCGKEIVYIDTRRERKMPCETWEAEGYVARGARVNLLVNGGIVKVYTNIRHVPSGEEIKKVRGYVPHFGARCGK